MIASLIEAQVANDNASSGDPRRSIAAAIARLTDACSEQYALSRDPDYAKMEAALANLRVAALALDPKDERSPPLVRAIVDTAIQTGMLLVEKIRADKTNRASHRRFHGRRRLDG